MAKYGPKAQQKVERAMHEFKQGSLRSGSGRKVTSREQAVAIGLSEAREAGAKVPPEKRSSAKESSSKSAKRTTGRTSKSAKRSSRASKSKTRRT